MPTHRDHPWERDLAAVLGRPERRRSWGTPIALAVVIAAAFAASLLLRPGGADLAAGPQAAARKAPAPASPDAVTRLRSRYLGRATLEVWGRTSAPDGATVQLRLGAGRPDAVRRAAPAVEGRFYAKVRLPGALRGRALRVSAAVGD